ncbi:MAG: 16S rRNA (guanine(527)-N(7))-methyltransferase RsmG [Verrucomicrobia bacterium]|nr:16S rRNA (guanine(527)-N(7))-methyltransferase RsmG [Verrucomicrobiota bacterium]MCH8513972.1 16S rRNA (guanine(527)-N(7))-methyltransferase RsmG [Kiritimatiellia bacterium]
MHSPPKLFHDACAAQGLKLTPEQLDTLSRYLHRLLEVNQHLNLTAVRDPDTAWMRHIFDSITLLTHMIGDPGQQALDLGSGGGLPGMPLAILRPDVSWTLVDSVAKKARFLEETATTLGLKNVAVRSERAEVLGRLPETREQFHLVTARAVARLPTLLELTVPLLRIKGRLFAMKGEKAGEELAESGIAMERLKVRLRLQEPTPEGGTLLIFKKHEATAKKYPRPVGVPGKEPLL